MFLDPDGDATSIPGMLAGPDTFYAVDG